MTTLATACKTKKGLQIMPDISYSDKELIRNFLARPAIDFYSGKASVKVKSSNGTDRFTLYVRSRTDSILWISGKRLSVEGGRMQMDDSTATIINRLDKTYQVLPLDTLESYLGFTGDLGYLQDMILGITPELDTAAVWETSQDISELVIKSQAQNLLHKFIVDKKSGTVSGGQFDSKFGASGTWTYGDYKDVGEQQYLPHFRKYEVQIDEENYLSLEMDFSVIEINVPKSIRFNVPTHYKRLP